ncbi:HEPN domain protein [Methanobrevibacter cuticularis]|uniref:HEPN domain protein n=1 Tax=Methanobrevibacter cuticularis TaxID=47311 RepID=A0A166EDY2_9EURY|nr:HEPN domain-containing protein [Methanobrevibacter cuticularis]KZX16545.1 HEPN domain protein [Methanobrevibacter cuticularis]
MDEIEDYVEKAKSKLKSSKTLYEIGQYGDSVSISYYVMFSAAKALLLLKGSNTKTHKGLISLFGKKYIKEDNFNQDLYKKFVKTQTLRQQVDYDATDNINKKIAKSALDLSESFLNESLKFLKK